MHTDGRTGDFVHKDRIPNFIRLARRFRLWCSETDRHTYEGKSLTPQFQLHKILWVAVSSTVGLRVERRHHLQSVCLQDVVLVDQTGLRLGCKVDAVALANHT
ncbi:hypothetical protein AVEN_199208-1 [Araneus ventricosus]|uniref:Uncharacterized protein n=1 Tax=Araneus ventricosus TaxID=182803 RepID=A0A4Y2LS61_ARAVE|nr:hypothetical protein AVEN_81787-1 [Araneus ventricosus]GBN16197.1 hypothetical protein AVEN_155868-1 [Araneus ventricosus]GBN16204.1 hypothetical protein AVEN_174567-1 [Araneus ventricosus]GBN16206.1 hypothetical protein AVEN_199208-1 [Araneus ventricosus]